MKIPIWLLLPLLLAAGKPLACAQVQPKEVAWEHYRLAQKQYNQGSRLEALETIGKAIALDSTNSAFFIERGRILADLPLVFREYRNILDKEVCRAAEADFRRAQVLDSTSTLPWRQLTELYYKCNEYAPMLEATDRWLELEDNPYGYCDCILYKHNVHYRPGMKDPFHYIDLCLAEVSDHSWALYQKSTVLRDLGRYDEAVEIHLAKLRYTQDSARVYLEIGFIYLNAQLYKKAESYFDLSIDQNPKQSFAYSNRSQCKLHQGRIEEAMEDIEYSIQINPTNSWAYKNRGLIYLEMGELEKACADWHTALEKGYSIKYDNEVDQFIQEHCR